MDRRRFIRTASLGVGTALVLPGTFGCRSIGTPAGLDGWSQVPGILARIRPPAFPDLRFELTDFGAVADGATDATQAFRDAIQACHVSGGGRVVVPEGVVLTGPIHLRSNVELHVPAGATIRFQQDPSYYLPLVYTRYEGMELMNYSPFIYAFEQENIAITGSGVIDGNADCEHWWPWKGRSNCGWSEGDAREHPARARLMEMVEEGVPGSERVFGEGAYIRPNFIQPYRCRNVLIEGVELWNSPMWCLHPTLCENVTVRGVRVVSHGPNNDGCNPESCRNVLIEGCFFDTGDDCIAIKSGRNAEGRRIGVPSENIVIRECEMRDGHGGVVIGSEMSGGVRNVFAEDCRMDSPNLDRALRIKTNSVRGGFVENVYMRNVQVGQVADAVFRVNFFYEEGDAGEHDPLVRNVEMRAVTCEKTRHALYIRGYDHVPVRDVRLIDCHFRNVEQESVIENVDGLSFENVTIDGVPVSTPAVDAIHSGN